MNHSAINEFHNAILKGDYDTVQDLICYRREISKDEIEFPMDENGLKPLHVVCRRNYRDIAKLLIDNGADINAFDEFEMTPLLWAASQSDNIEFSNLIALLIGSGADLSLAGPNGYTAFMWLCARGDYLLVKDLLSQNVIDVDKRDKNGNTPLMIAVKYKQSKVVEQFKNYYKNYIDKKNKDGMTALMFAVNVGDKESVKILLEEDANVNSKTKDGLTALDFAEIKNDLKIIKLLQERKAENGKLKFQRTTKRVFSKNRKTVLNKTWQNVFMFLLGIATATALLSCFMARFTHLSKDAENKIVNFATEKFETNLNNTLARIESDSTLKINETLNRLDIDSPLQLKIEESLSKTFAEMESVLENKITSDFDGKLDKCFAEIKVLCMEKMSQSVKDIENTTNKKLGDLQNSVQSNIEKIQTSAEEKLDSSINSKIEKTFEEIKNISTEKVEEMLKTVEVDTSKKIETLENEEQRKTLENDGTKSALEKISDESATRTDVPVSNEDDTEIAKMELSDVSDESTENISASINTTNSVDDKKDTTILSEQSAGKDNNNFVETSENKEYSNDVEQLKGDLSSKQEAKNGFKIPKIIIIIGSIIAIVVLLIFIIVKKR